MSLFRLKAVKALVLAGIVGGLVVSCQEANDESPMSTKTFDAPFKSYPSKAFFSHSRGCFNTNLGCCGQFLKFYGKKVKLNLNILKYQNLGRVSALISY